VGKCQKWVAKKINVRKCFFPKNNKMINVNEKQTAEFHIGFLKAKICFSPCDVKPLIFGQIANFVLCMCVAGQKLIKQTFWDLIMILSNKSIENLDNFVALKT
jgi:hypothetical protein